MKQERIICAAARHNSVIVLGPRHWDAMMHKQARTFFGGESYAELEWEEGFMGLHQNFITREEAWTIAGRARQIMHEVGGDDRNGGTLYSENLY